MSRSSTNGYTKPEVVWVQRRVKMRHAARIATLGALASATLFAGVLTPAAQASFGPENFEAGTCINNYVYVRKRRSEPLRSATPGRRPPALGHHEVHDETQRQQRRKERSKPDPRRRPAGPRGQPGGADAQVLRRQFNEPKAARRQAKSGTIEMEADARILPALRSPCPSSPAPSTTSNRRPACRSISASSRTRR